MSGVEIVVLSVTIAVFVTITIAWLVLRAAPKFPEGERFVARHDGVEVVLITRIGEVDPIAGKAWWPLVARSCARAVSAASAGWLGAEIADVGLRRFVVLVLAENAFGFNTWAQSVAAYQVWTGTRLGGGRGLPQIVMREALCSEVVDTGEPVIHESLHAMGTVLWGKSDEVHSNARVWIAAGGERSVQAVARRRYSEAA